jgi:hypothetical protein
MPNQRRKRNKLAFFALLIMPLFVAACDTTPPQLTATPSLPTSLALTPPPLRSAVPPTSAARSTLPSTTPALPTLQPTDVTPTPNPTLVAGLIGLWKGDNGSFYRFNPDGTWNWDEQRGRVEQAPENQGTWWIEGDVLNIVDLSGKEPCPRSQIGRYQMQFIGDALVLSRVKDLCRARVPQTAGTYSRLSGNP